MKMAHYAFIDENNMVADVITGKSEGNFDWEQQYGAMRGMLCKRTSYNTRGGIHYDPDTNQPSTDQSKSLRKNYAGIGYTYDQQRDAFIPPKPYPSWVLNDETCLWESPVPYPDDGGRYYWNESTASWVKVEMNE
jgi:hypothetical protein